MAFNKYIYGACSPELNIMERAAYEDHRLDEAACRLQFEKAISSGDSSSASGLTYGDFRSTVQAIGDDKGLANLLNYVMDGKWTGWINGGQSNGKCTKIMQAPPGAQAKADTEGVSIPKTDAEESPASPKLQGIAFQRHPTPSSGMTPHEEHPGGSCR